eukprot:1574-Pelagococcus_subviridis.AAC.1
MYACVHSCARIAPAAMSGKPYNTTTAFTVCPAVRVTTRSLNPNPGNPELLLNPLPPFTFGTRSTVRMRCSWNMHRPRVRAVRPRCHPSTSSASLSISCGTEGRSIRANVGVELKGVRWS